LTFTIILIIRLIKNIKVVKKSNINDLLHNVL
jgi:hypothetical protein